MSGLRVLWFERDAAGAFTPPAGWTREAAAMTSTHDLPPLAGWWSECDLCWRSRLGLLGDDTARWYAHEERARDRGRLWSTLCASGATQGEPPAQDQPAAFVDAACRHVAGAACDVALFPVEDILGLTEQPNLPGTLNEHPNWRRRLPGAAATLLDAPEAEARLAAIAEARRS
jgi:4-alpha-glucanotransferase